MNQTFFLYKIMYLHIKVVLSHKIFSVCMPFLFISNFICMDAVPLLNETVVSVNELYGLVLYIELDRIILELILFTTSL